MRLERPSPKHSQRPEALHHSHTMAWAAKVEAAAWAAKAEQRDGAIGAVVIACAVALGVYLNPASLGLCPLP